ncbi:MAG: hypothetical protein Q8R74_13995 [Methylophilus sp.]|jgi:hypothetical protein|nr:hypothetical protein [Methylophilus sp.]
MESVFGNHNNRSWNKDKLVGQKIPLLKEICGIRIRLELALDNKLRGCDLVKLKVREISNVDRISSRAIVMQQKTSHPRAFHPASIRMKG